MTATDREVLADYTWQTDKQPDGPFETIVTGGCLRVRRRTTPGGGTKVTFLFSQRTTSMRASGKVWSSWRSEKWCSFTRSAHTGLVFARRGAFTKNQVSTTYLMRPAGADVDPRAASEQIYLSSLAAITHCLPWSTDEVDFLSDDLAEACGAGADRRTGGATSGANSKLAATLFDVIGELPTVEQRFPLLLVSKAPVARGVNAWGFLDRECRDPRVDVNSLPFLDATDYRQVAGALFGKTRCTRPLVRVVTQWCEAGMPDALIALRWFAQFRGLVPIDWITDVMDPARVPAIDLGTNFRGVRSILRATPDRVLKRILAEPARDASRTLNDGAAMLAPRDISGLPALIAARGQRHIRGSVDLEQLILRLPGRERPAASKRGNGITRERDSFYAMRRFNTMMDRLRADGHADAVQARWDQWRDPDLRAELEAFLDGRRDQLDMAAQHERERLEQEYRQRDEAQRHARLEREADRGAWAAQVTSALNGATCDSADGKSWRFEVADDEATLVLWGARMNNCIGAYGRGLGLNVLVGVFDESDDLRLCAEVTQSYGLQQLLGANNRDATKAIGTDAAQAVLDVFRLGGIPVEAAYGTAGLDRQAMEPVAA